MSEQFSPNNTSPSLKQKRISSLASLRSASIFSCQKVERLPEHFYRQKFKLSFIEVQSEIPLGFRLIEELRICAKQLRLISEAKQKGHKSFGSFGNYESLMESVARDRIGQVRKLCNADSTSKHLRLKIISQFFWMAYKEYLPRAELSRAENVFKKEFLRIVKEHIKDIDDPKGLILRQPEAFVRGLHYILEKCPKLKSRFHILKRLAASKSLSAELLLEHMPHFVSWAFLGSLCYKNINSGIGAAQVFSKFCIPIARQYLDCSKNPITSVWYKDNQDNLWPIVAPLLGLLVERLYGAKISHSQARWIAGCWHEISEDPASSVGINLSALLALRRKSRTLPEKLRSNFGIVSPGRFPLRTLMRQANLSDFTRDQLRGKITYNIAAFGAQDWNGSYFDRKGEIGLIERHLGRNHFVIITEFNGFETIISRFCWMKAKFGKAKFCDFLTHGGPLGMTPGILEQDEKGKTTNEATLTDSFCDALNEVLARRGFVIDRSCFGASDNGVAARVGVITGRKTYGVTGMNSLEIVQVRTFKGSTLDLKCDDENCLIVFGERQGMDSNEKQLKDYLDLTLPIKARVPHRRS